MRLLRWILAACAIAALAGCGSKKEYGKIVEGEKVSQNPIGLARQVAKAGEDFERIQKELENMKPATPVHFSQLIKFLPEPQAGWESQPAKGASNQMGEWSFTTVERQYDQGDKHIEIEILDWAFHKELYASFFVTAAFSQETTEGYNKGLKIGDEPGREEYTNASKNGTLSLLVGKRFFVTVKGSSIEPAELRQWLDRIDTKALRAKAA